MKILQEKIDKFGLKISPSKVADYQINNVQAGIACTITGELADICYCTYRSGFLNINLNTQFIINNLKIPKAKSNNNQTVIIDYSSPNAKKPMHVGHIKSTILGDCLHRVYKFMGYNVIPKNHIGDYNVKEYAVQTNIYDIYKQLDILLTPKDSYPESYYKDMLEGVVADLLGKNIAVYSQGAVCLFGEKIPAIIKKSNSSYTYMTIDLAAIKYWSNKIKAGRMIYVVGAAQADHFATLFSTAKKAGWCSGIELIHVPFGCILGESGKPFKTRDGDNPLLQDLIDNAKANAAMTCSGTDTVNAIAVGMLKYSNLMVCNVTDYVFNPAKMLSTQGNTAMYLQYCFAKISAIQPLVQPVVHLLKNPLALKLAKKLIMFDDVVQNVLDTNEPKHLTDYLYSLASIFNSLYAVSKIADNAENLYLSTLTSKTLCVGLSLLGIKPVENI